MDNRNVRSGYPIPVSNYSDQPYVVKTDDGGWLMVVTTGVGTEGSKGQHIASAKSFDCGKTWSEPVCVESPENPESSYAVLYKTSYGRVYCFYNYNAENRRFVLVDPGWLADEKCYRVDSQGSFVYKYTDDNGKTWSDKWYEIPQRVMATDRSNPYGGKVLYFWNVGKPFTLDNRAFVPLYKIGGLKDTFMYKTEGVLLKCDNINTERDASKLHWETLPDGDHGIKVPREVSDVSEEHSFVTLSDGSIFCVFRTVSGNSYCAYSRDKGHTFTVPEKMTYADGRPMRHPRAANFIWKCQNGKYLYWYHNHGGKTYDDRNPVWLSGAVEYAAADGMRLKFSQPEILLYDPDVMIRMSYPDMIEEGGAYYFTETQKCLARTHKAETSLIEGLWSQFDKEGERKHGIVLQNGSAMPELRPFIERDYTANDNHSVDTGASFSLLLTADFDKPGVLFSTMTQDHRGMEAAFDGEKIVFTLGDGRRTNVFYSDKAPLAAKGVHTVVVQVDAGSRVVSMMIDRKVCDGADERQFGYGWFDRSLLHANGNQTAFVGEQVCLAELFPNGLTNSEAFWL